MYDLTKDAANAIPFVMVDSAGTEVTGLGGTFTVTVRKDGGSFGASAGAKAELASGWYLYTATAGECDTAGPLALKITGAGCVQQNLVYRVGDPWATPLPGAYPAGTAGKALSDILVDTGTTLPALISAGTGTGLYSETITVNDGDGLPVDGVLVQVATDSAFSNVVRSGVTNNFGQVTLNFDAIGTYYGRAEISDFNVSTFTVTVS